MAKYQSWKSRLSERFSPDRERITWEGEILGYTGGFLPERELSRLGGGVDVYVLVSGCGKCADKVVAVGDLCEISDQASGMGPVSAKRVRTPLRKRDRCLFSKCHERNLYYSVDMRDDVPAVFNPGNGLADIGNARYRGGVPQSSALNVVPAKVFLFRE
ncbi:hypothetical protein Lal_00042977, partial [Lupinus albus]